MKVINSNEQLLLRVGDDVVVNAGLGDVNDPKAEVAAGVVLLRSLAIVNSWKKIKIKRISLKINRFLTKFIITKADYKSCL